MKHTTNQTYMIIAIAIIVIMFVLSYFLMRGNSCEPCITPDVTTEPYDNNEISVPIDRYKKGNLMIRPTCGTHADGSITKERPNPSRKDAAKIEYPDLDIKDRYDSQVKIILTLKDNQIDKVTFGGFDISESPVYTRNMAYNFTLKRKLRLYLHDFGMDDLKQFLSSFKYVENSTAWDKYTTDCYTYRRYSNLKYTTKTKGTARSEIMLSGSYLLFKVDDREETYSDDDGDGGAAFLWPHGWKGLDFS